MICYWLVLLNFFFIEYVYKNCYDEFDLKISAVRPLVKLLGKSSKMEK